MYLTQISAIRSRRITTKILYPFWSWEFLLNYPFLSLFSSSLPFSAFYCVNIEIFLYHRHYCLYWLLKWPVWKSKLWQADLYNLFCNRVDKSCFRRWRKKLTLQRSDRSRLISFKMNLWGILLISIEQKGKFLSNILVQVTMRDGRQLATPSCAHSRDLCQMSLESSCWWPVSKYLWAGLEG